MERRQFLAVGGLSSLTAISGCLSNIPVIGGTSCPKGPDEIGEVNDGGAIGNQVEVRGKMDHSLVVDARGILAFKIDGQTGTIPVYLDNKNRGNEIRFGECLTVRGVVANGSDREVRGPVVENATLV